MNSAVLISPKIRTIREPPVHVLMHSERKKKLVTSYQFSFKKENIFKGYWEDTHIPFSNISILVHLSFISPNSNELLRLWLTIFWLFCWNQFSILLTLLNKIRCEIFSGSFNTIKLKKMKIFLAWNVTFNINILWFNKEYSITLDTLKHWIGTSYLGALWGTTA